MIQPQARRPGARPLPVRGMKNKRRARAAHLLLLLLQLLAALPLGLVGSSLADFDGATFYKAPVGARVRIACNGSYWGDESVSLVLWFKGSGNERHSVPIYTIDARQKPLNAGARHFVADQYKGRARFISKASPPYLDLSPLEASDESEYRCRIDYRAKPRENFLIILFVLVPPRSVQVSAMLGSRQLKPVESAEAQDQVEAHRGATVYGPLSEGSELTLICLSKGGRPAPALTWRRRERATKVIDDSYLTHNDFVALQRLSDERQRRTMMSSSLSPEKRSAEGEERPTYDNNQLRSTPMADSINSRSALESFELWQSWPEYAYYLSAGSNWSPASKQSDQLELGAKPDESLSSAVNVLQLSNLPHSLVLPAAEQNQVELSATNGSLLGPNREQQQFYDMSSSSSSSSSSWAQLPEFECQASNLHYDLRTLIKLYAPASLGSPARATRPLWDEMSVSLPSNVADWQTRSGEPEQAAVLWSVGQSVPLEATNASADHGRSAVHQQSTDWSSLERHLLRAHQLASSALELESSSTVPSPATPSNETGSVRSKAVALNIYLRPTDVRITGDQRPLAAGQVAEFSCVASGSRPPAKIVWSMRRANGQARPVEASSWRQIVEGRTNSSLSRLTLQVEREDHQAQLSCRAENEQLNKLRQIEAQPPGNALEDSRTLTVHYPPIVRLELGNPKLSNSIGQGQDIYFVCQVDSQPQVREIAWLHNDQPIELELADSRKSSDDGQLKQRADQTTGKGLIMVSNNSLVLQQVSVDQRGWYACVATNSEGLSASNKIELRVLRAPACVNKPLATRQAANVRLVANRKLALGERTSLVCRMDADPTDGLEVSWYLSANDQLGLQPTEPSESGQQSRPTHLTWSPASSLPASIEAQSHWRKLITAHDGKSAKYALASPSSQLNYLVESGADYGLVYCLARNSVGSQTRACAYRIQPAETVAQGNQQSALSCLASNVTASSVLLACLTPSSMSQPYRFHLSVYASPDLLEPDEQAELDWPLSDEQAGDQHWRLEANLSTLALTRPMLLLQQLKPKTRYALQVYPLDVSPPLDPASVQFITSSDASAPSLAGSGEPVVVEPHANEGQPAALLSVPTRSISNGATLSPARANSKRAPVQSSSFSLSDWLLGAWQDLFQSSQSAAKSAPGQARLDASRAAPVSRPGNSSRGRQQQQLRPSSELMSLADASLLGLLASALLLTLLGLAALALITRRRKRQVHMQRSARPLDRGLQSTASRLASVGRAEQDESEVANAARRAAGLVGGRQAVEEDREEEFEEEEEDDDDDDDDDDLDDDYDDGGVGDGDDGDIEDENESKDRQKAEVDMAERRLVSETLARLPGRRPSNSAQVTLEQWRPGCARVSKSRSTLCFGALDGELARLSSKEDAELQWRESLARSAALDSNAKQAWPVASRQALIRDTNFNSLERRQTGALDRSKLSRSSQAGQLILDYASGRACPPTGLLECLLVEQAGGAGGPDAPAGACRPASVQADAWAPTAGQLTDGPDRSHQFITQPAASMTIPITTMSDANADQLKANRMATLDCPSMAPDRFNSDEMQFIELLPADYALVHQCPSSAANQAALMQAAVWANLRHQPSAGNHLLSDQSSLNSSATTRLTACYDHHNHHLQHLCPSLASSSSPPNSNKDPFMSSPLSLTNTTISNAESFTASNQNSQPNVIPNFDRQKFTRMQMELLELSQSDPRDDKINQKQSSLCDQNQVAISNNAHAKTNTLVCTHDHPQPKLTSILKNSRLAKNRQMVDFYELTSAGESEGPHSCLCNGDYPIGNINADLDVRRDKPN